MTAPARPELTERQLQVLTLLADGLTHWQAAHRLGISKAALNDRLKEAVRKLGATSTPHAVLIACRAGILDGRPQRHGDHAGYAAHKYRGEDPKDCPHGCWEGEQAYRTAQRRARKARQKLPAS